MTNWKPTQITMTYDTKRITNWKPVFNGMEAKSYLPGMAKPITWVVFQADDGRWRSVRHGPEGFGSIELDRSDSEAAAMARCEREANK